MSEGRSGAHSSQQEGASFSHGINLNDLPGSLSIEQRLLFVYLERIAVAVEAMGSHQDLQDRAIGLLHSVGFSRRKVAAALGKPESSMRGPKWAKFNEVLQRGRSMERGLDVTRMANQDEAGEE